MAKEVIIELKAKTDKIEKDVQGINKEIKTLNKNVDKTADGFEGVEKASKETAEGVKKIGTTLKAIGIGLLLAAFSKLKEVFEQNQKVTDAFNIAFESLSIAFNDFFRFLENNVGTITSFFTDIFENPKESLIEFADAFKRNIQERFESYLDTLGFLASAVKKVFSGDFAGALEDVKSAGKESLDVLTGVDGTFEKSVETVGKATKAIKDYAQSTLESATENVNLNKQVELANALQQGLIEKYDLQAEQQRQIRDDESKTIEERIAANTRLGEILDKQEKEMLANAQLRVDAAARELAKNEDNLEAQVALIEAENELAGVQAQVAGFRSEQLTNLNSLEKESLEIKNGILESDANRQKAERDFNAEMQENEVTRIQTMIENLEIERGVEEERLKIKKNGLVEGTQAFIDANNELLDFQQESNLQQGKLEKDLGKAKVSQTKETLGNLATIVGKNSKFGKAIAIVQALQDTYAGANKALAQGGIFGFVGAAAVIAAGIANVKQIAGTKSPKPPASLGARDTGGESTPAIPSASTSSVPPQFDTVGASGTNQLADLLGNQPPPRAFVVSGDVSTAQELDRNIVTSASLG